jgi:hypothetical protein
MPDLEIPEMTDVTIGKEEPEKTEKEEKQEKKFVFANQGEAEKAYREARKKMQEAAEEAARLRKSKTEGKELVDYFNAEKQKLIQSTIAKVASIQLPKEDEPDYAKKLEAYNLKVAEVWVDTQDAIAELVLARERQKQADVAVVQVEINKKLKEAKLDNIPKIHDIFRVFSSDANPELTIEDQIDETIERCKEYMESIKNGERTRATEEEKERKRLEALGRGGKFRATEKTPNSPTNTSMREAQDRALDYRRVSKK